MRYGCHDLRIGDHDANPQGQRIWGGQANAPISNCPGTQLQIAPGANNQLNIPQHVRQLQEDLRTLGFSVVGAPSGTFDLATHWAVREFQAHAKMGNVAKIKTSAVQAAQQGAHLVSTQGILAGSNPPVSIYVNSLESATNDLIYTGHVSGVLNQATRDALEHWLTENWRCPVIIEAWNVHAGARTTLFGPANAPAVNVWRHDEVQNSGPRFYARDFSGYYTLPTGRQASDYQVIGDFVTYMTWSGPRSVPPSHTWAEAEFIPGAIFGIGPLTLSETSMFSVVRSVAEIECIGFFDSVNCYDNAFVSQGPCHWTLGIINGNSVSEGELCGYLAYLRQVDAAAFQSAVGFFGVQVDENWVNAAGVDSGSILFDSHSAKYTGWMAQENESGQFIRMPSTEAEGNYFKTWHWHYRFVMAGRTIVGYRQRMYHMACIRIRDIRRVPWGQGVADIVVSPGSPPQTPPTTRPATIGDVFTSEKAMALILRWHVRFPAHMVNTGPGTKLKGALADAKAAQPTLIWNGDPSSWTNAHEAALVHGLLSQAATLNNSQFSGDLHYVDTWPNWVGGTNPHGFALSFPVTPLSSNRNSMNFDASILPPGP